MAFRTWGRLLLTALGVSLLAGAGQLGIAFGFGIVRLTGTFTGGTVNQWPAQLVWVGWFAANAAVVGAVLTERVARRDGLLAGTGRQLAVATAAAAGATVVAPLCMQPARAAELISVDPVWAVGICAILGAVLGAGAALAVLVRPPVGWNMALVAGAVWLVALISVAPTLVATGPLPTVRLGVLEPSWLDAGAAQRLSLVVPPLLALLAGAATGGLARWRGHPPLVSGATGVAGPVLVAFAYLTAGPGDVVDRYQTTPYYGALIAVAAGALGSAAATLLRWPLVPHGADTGAIEPTDILRSLPAGPTLPTAATRSADRAGDESETVDLAAAGQAAGGRPGDAGPGTAGGPAAGTTPAHWDWPVPGAAPAATAHPTPTAAGTSAPSPTSTGADRPTAAKASTPSPTSAEADRPAATAEADRPATADVVGTRPVSADAGTAAQGAAPSAGEVPPPPPDQSGDPAAPSTVAPAGEPVHDEPTSPAEAATAPVADGRVDATPAAAGTDRPAAKPVRTRRPRSAAQPGGAEGTASPPPTATGAVDLPAGVPTRAAEPAPGAGSAGRATGDEATDAPDATPAPAAGHDATPPLLAAPDTCPL
ncbi:hypothetical protein [Micromonospora deserti]|uniref:hypothetical protein n=1 Tax=Micromonospora deserti TaxID=2070366 RepID=UPI0018F79CA7|nr:hypothetical protein [Micromonospora deserti]